MVLSFPSLSIACHLSYGKRKTLVVSAEGVANMCGSFPTPSQQSGNDPHLQHRALSHYWSSEISRYDQESEVFIPKTHKHGDNCITRRRGLGAHRHHCQLALRRTPIKRRAHSAAGWLWQCRASTHHEEQSNASQPYLPAAVSNSRRLNPLFSAPQIGDKGPEACGSSVVRRCLWCGCSHVSAAGPHGSLKRDWHVPWWHSLAEITFRRLNSRIVQ